MHFGVPVPKMICRHSPGDRSCTTQYPPPPEPVLTPDVSKFEIIEAEQVGPHLVLKVKYPNCARCAFEGTKILIYEHCTAMHALKWRRIDPHFRNTQGKQVPASEAPCPLARFPASDAGWADALHYAKLRQG